MNVTVIKIGNSRGIRIPKTVIDELEIKDQVEMKIVDREIIITPVQESLRAGWQDSFDRIHKEGEDDLLIDEALESEDFEWEW